MTASRSIKGVYAAETGLITGVNYAITAEAGGRVAAFEGTADVPYDGGEIVPFDQVTPSIVFSWLGKLGVDADAIEAQLAAQLVYQATVPKLVQLTAADAPPVALAPVEAAPAPVDEAPVGPPAPTADLEIPPVPEAAPVNA